jgi:hypothetical protein
VGDDPLGAIAQRQLERVALNGHGEPDLIGVR